MKPQERTRAILKSGLDATQKIILVAIADHMEDTAEGPDRNARPSVGLLCAETGLSERTLQGHVQALIKAGILSRHQIPGHRTPHYLIAWGSLPPQNMRPAESAPRNNCGGTPAESAPPSPAESAPKVDQEGTIKGTRERGGEPPSPKAGRPEPEPQRSAPVESPPHRAVQPAESMLAQSIQVVWQAWKARRGGGITPHPKLAGIIGEALSAASVESLVLLVEWWNDETTPKSDPVWWRLERPNHGLADVLNGAKLEGRLAQSADWHNRGRVAATPTGPPAGSASQTEPPVKKRTLSLPIPGEPHGNPSSPSASPGTVRQQLPPKEPESMGRGHAADVDAAPGRSRGVGRGAGASHR